mmetsp:Transcript_44270/g.69287  ORF Transcript_44270/g.69287 Transcript_44270/m.69287 type:complete len:245 (+) Transcript_44270:741-1475(+)
MPRRVADHIAKEFQIDGVQPLRAIDVEKMLHEGLKKQHEIFVQQLKLVSENMTASMTQLVQHALAAPSPSAAESTPQQNPPTTSSQQLPSSMEYPSQPEEATLPPDFTFPKCDVKTLWNLWYFGNSCYNNSGIRVGPYRLIEARQLKTQREKEQFSRAKKVMAVLERLVVLSLKQNRFLMPEQQFQPLNGDDLSSDISSRSAAFSDKLFSDIIPQFISFVYDEQSSAGPSDQQPPPRKKKKTAK